uniref:Uncharacterized protein n=1 Tax=Mola mola TaxID=94237 RepID=A0A3Q4BS88_MOLML
MATAPPPSLHMRSTDLIKREPLDYGGFGDVFLCYHATLGRVVLKTIYTGTLLSAFTLFCRESKRLLLAEGSIMASLNHERVVKLLGVIMEDKDCSLVMELIPRGNLLAMLEAVSVPLSIKGRIIVEILEAMVYLAEQHVIHKDIKPENILVDKDFHIKIADLGLATCQAWSKLTKEESRRKSHKGRSAGVRGAGTLSYMAPEHLENIHTASTEKSDVYSFAIVVWVILTREEPYANARSEDQMCQCVRNGNRPAEDLIPSDVPPEMIRLMKWGWSHNPVQRPTFKGVPLICMFKKLYEGPDDLVEKMKSLSMVQEIELHYCYNLSCCFADCPAPLVSSDMFISAPVEASIEDICDIQYVASGESIHSDAKAGNSPSALEEKLDQELQYHIHGSYNHKNPSDAMVRQLEQDRPSNASSVLSWTKAPVQPTSQDEAIRSSSLSPSHLPSSVSASSLPQFNQEHPLSHYDRQKSWPAYPVSDTSAPDINPGRILTPSKRSLFIQNASGIQIGSNNTMRIRGYESQHSLLSQPANALTNFPIKEGILKYEDHPVTEDHLDLLRENIGAKWKRCARRLGLTSVEVETIEHDCYRDGLPEMVHQMLDRWKMKEGSIGCTVGKLCRALEGNIKVDVIQKILDTCHNSS